MNTRLVCFFFYCVQLLPQAIAKGETKYCHHDNPDDKNCKPCRRLFRGMECGETISQFIAREISPTNQFNRHTKKVIDDLVRSLQEMSAKSFSIKRIVKSGSLGKGTAVKGKSDIDLIIFFNGYSSVSELQADKPRLLKKLKEHVMTKWAEDLLFKDMTKFSVQFYLNFEGNVGSHEVDLLPALDITQSGRERDDIYREMEDLPEEKRRAYSSCLSPLQLQFVRETDGLYTPPKIKDIMRLLKYWIKVEKVPVKSYLIELLVIRVWRQEGKKNKVDEIEFLGQVLALLSNMRSMSITFNDNYDYAQYRLSLTKPYLLDPANPFMNVAVMSAKDIDQVTEKSLTLLDRLSEM